MRIKKITLSLTLLVWSILLKAQQLYLGANLGLSFPVNTEIQRGIYFQPGTAWPEWMADLEARLILKNNLTLSTGIYRGHCMLTGEIRKENWPAFFIIPGFGIDLYDARLAVGYRFSLTKRWFVTPELAGHCLFGREQGLSTGSITFSDGVQIAMATYFNKPAFVPAMSAALLMDWVFKGGFSIRASGRFEHGFQTLGYSDYYITDAGNNSIEEYHFGSTLRMFQVNLGFHYPISRIWQGKNG